MLPNWLYSDMNRLSLQQPKHQGFLPCFDPSPLLDLITLANLSKSASPWQHVWLSLLAVYVNGAEWSVDDVITTGTAFLELLLDFMIFCNRTPWNYPADISISTLLHSFTKDLKLIAYYSGLPLPVNA